MMSANEIVGMFFLNIVKYIDVGIVQNSSKDKIKTSTCLVGFMKLKIT